MVTLGFLSTNIFCLLDSVLVSLGCHRMGCLNNSHLFLKVLETEKSKIKVLANLVPGENTFPGLQTAAF